VAARRCGLGVAAALLLTPAIASAAAPADQAGNLVFSSTRSHDLSPQLLAQAAQIESAKKQRHFDAGRAPDPNPCTAPICVGDPRLYDWKGIVKPVLFTARDGATLSGHVWATRGGPRRKPGVVIVNGSIVGFEDAYWWAAQSLARDGYVVLTFDAQGEGDSDQLGEAPDQGESLIAGTPPIGDGGPFYDGGEDAIDFFLSTRRHPYVPRASRTSHTSHAAKQAARVKAGLDAPYNPLAHRLDRRRIGLAGHSYGADSTSYLAQADQRVSAEVAWDSLCIPKDSTRAELAAFGDAPGTTPVGGFAVPTGANTFPRDCFGAPPGYTPDVKIRVPALGLAGDYIAPLPLADTPDHDTRTAVPKAYRAAGVDSGVIIVRGGNHLEWSWVPAPAGTLRGADLSAWYTAAWFDRYLKHDPTADARLLTDRWRRDAAGQAADPAHDANLFSRYYASRLDFHTRAGAHVVCADLRTCSQLRADACPKAYGYLPVALGKVAVSCRRRTR
jgi:dienelactone hydrolase